MASQMLRAVHLDYRRRLHEILALRFGLSNDDNYFIEVYNVSLRCGLAQSRRPFRASFKDCLDAEPEEWIAFLKAGDTSVLGHSEYGLATRMEPRLEEEAGGDGWHKKYQVI